MNSRLDYSFPSFQDKIEVNDIDDHIQMNNSFSIMNVTKIFEECESNLNISQIKSKKKGSLEDISYSMNQPFYENSHLIEEEFRSNAEENYMKIDNEDQSQSIIQEINYYEGNNDSFLHDTDFISKVNEMPSNSFDILNTSIPIDIIKDDILDEGEAQKIRKIFASLKLSKSSFINSNSLLYKKVNLNPKKLFTITPNEHLNRSYVSSGKRGRKKILLDGIKTEIIDRKYIRKFKKFIKSKKRELKVFFDEDPQFWNDFLQQNYPPFEFYSDKGVKKKYKSYSKGLLRLIFSKKSARDLYEMFLKEREKEFSDMTKYKNKQKTDKLTALFDKVYEKNLHKLYCDEYSNITIDEMDITRCDSVNLSSI